MFASCVAAVFFISRKLSFTSSEESPHFSAVVSYVSEKSLSTVFLIFSEWVLVDSSAPLRLSSTAFLVFDIWVLALFSAVFIASGNFSCIFLINSSVGTPAASSCPIIMSIACCAVVADAVVPSSDIRTP